MYQYEAVIKVMEDNGGFATLGYLYQHALSVKDCEWGTKTPYASIRRIVQDERFFFKIRPGLWALLANKDSVLKKFNLSENSPESKKDEFNHSYYQGLLVEIGNYQGYDTFIPYQDKNRMYLSSTLASYATLDTYYDFTYENVVKRAITIDVTWFNKRRFPYAFIEVEHTTDIQNSLLKFYELQDFFVKFIIVSAEDRRKEFEYKIAYNAFTDISQRVKFISYDYVSQLHAKSSELYALRMRESI